MIGFPLSVEIMKAIQVMQIRKSAREEDRDMEGCREDSWLYYILDTIDYDGMMADDIVKQAAFVLHTIATEHPFKQANKRSAWVIAKTLLMLSGLTMTVNPDEGERFMLEVSRSGYTRQEVEAWIRKHM
jgi:death-on-curing family protein